MTSTTAALAVSFLAPARLLLLLVPVALAAGYLLLAARRRRYAMRFTSLDLLDEVAPDRPGWRRTVPALLLLLGLAVAAVAVARPAVAGEIVRERDGLDAPFPLPAARRHAVEHAPAALLDKSKRDVERLIRIDVEFQRLHARIGDALAHRRFLAGIGDGVGAAHGLTARWPMSRRHWAPSKWMPCTTS